MKLLQIGASGRQEEVEVPGVGAAVGDWNSYTPTWTSYSNPQPALGNGSIGGRWRRVGDSLECCIFIYTGTTTTYGTDDWFFSIPSGISIDTNKALSPLGTGMLLDQGGESPVFGTVQVQDSTKVCVTNVGSFKSTTVGWLSGGDIIMLRFTVPISSWSSNVALATDFVEYVSCDGTEASSGVAANTTYTPATTNRLKAGSLFPAVAISATNSQTITTYNLDFETPILDSDKIFIEVSVGNGIWLPLICGMGTVSQYSQANGVHTGMLLGRTSTNNKRISVQFSNAGTRPGISYGTGQNTWSEARTNGWKWRVTKIGGRFSENGTDGYSTGETLTNKTWINGKPIYRKVVDLGSLPNSTTKSVAHGISGMTELISITGLASNGTYRFFLPYVWRTDSYSISLLVNVANIEVVTGSDRSTYTGYAILEYTK